MRWLWLFAAAPLAACATPPEPLSLCNLPRDLRSWRGTEVTWQGVVVDASPHGVFFACERRNRLGLSAIALDWPDAPARAEAGLRPLVRLRAEARIEAGVTDGDVLRMTRVISAVPMSAREEEAFMSQY